MDGFNGDDASDTLGYTLPKEAPESVSRFFHYPWDRRPPSVTAVRTKAKQERADSLFQRLAELMDKCMEAQQGGCTACPRRLGCNKWWASVTDEVSHGHKVMTREIFERRKAEFEGRIRPK